MSRRAPLSVVIPTLNAGERLAACLTAIVPAVVSGLVREVVVSDGGSHDATLAIAAEAGARILEGPAGRGGQLARGGEAASGDWLLFVHADTVLDAGWDNAARTFITQDAEPGGHPRAGVFRLAFDAAGWRARIVAGGAMVRTRLFRLPYGDQGLLISRALYGRLGGYAPLPLFEDVDFMRRLVRAHGRRAVSVLPVRAVTAADRYQAGYARRVFRNMMCLGLYTAGMAPEKLLNYYRSK